MPTHLEHRSRSVPPLFGLVLAGGKSKRMGRDKGLIDWHGKAQRYYLADLLAGHCQNVYISCRPDQAADIVSAGYRALPDSAEAAAQYGAILTALESQPAAAWLVVACDLPLIDNDTVAYVIGQRNPHKLATAYRNPGDGLPEPLAAIWEPAAKDMLRKKLAEGIDCPRKALIQSHDETKLIDPPQPAAIMNVNTPAALDAAREILKSYAV